MGKNDTVSTIKRRKILIKGYYGFGNLGDDILMITSFYILKKKYREADYYIFSSNHNEKYRQYILKLLSNDVNIIDWRSKERFDLVWRGGGGVFFDFNPGDISSAIINLFIRSVGIYSYASFFSLYEKLRNRTRTKIDKQVGIGIGLGKHTFSSRKFRDHCLDIAGASAIIVRDAASLSYLKQLKFKGYSSVQTDLAFYREAWVRTGRIYNSLDAHKRIGFILRDWKFVDASIENLFQAALMLQEKGNRVIFFSFDEKGDNRVVNRARELDFNVDIWQPNKVSLENYISQLSLNSLLVTARAHGAIIGNCLQIPSICLAIEPKLVQIHQMLPISTELISPPFLQSELIRLVDQIFGSYESYLNAAASEFLKNRQTIQNGLDEIEQYM